MRSRKPDPTISFVHIEERADLGWLVDILIRHSHDVANAAAVPCDQPVGPGTPQSAPVESRIARCVRTAVTPSKRRSP